MGSTTISRGVLAWCVLIAAVAVPSLYAYHRARLHTVSLAIESRGTLMLDVLESSIAGHLHNGKYQTQRLQDILDRLSEAHYVAALGVGEGDAQVGQSTETTTGAPGEGRRFRFSRETTLVAPQVRQNPERGPSARAGWRPFPVSPVTLWVDLTDEEWRERMGEAWLEGITGSLLALAIMVSGGLFIHARERRASLANELVRAELRAAQKAEQAQMAVGLTHETKNPLGVVRGLAQRIEETSESAERRETARAIVDEVDRTVRQINGFLELSRTPAPEMTPVAVRPLTEELSGLMRGEAEAQGGTLEVDVDDVTILGDASLLRRLLMNLLINALHATTGGGWIRLTGIVHDGAMVLSIADGGCGIPPEDLPEVRRPYFSRFEGGTGLGLALADQIATAHGWRLTIDSEPGVGTTVRLSGLEVVP